MNKKYTLKLSFLVTASITWAMDNNNNQVMADNTYKGIQITPETIIRLVQAPEVVAADFQTFNAQNPGLLIKLTSFVPFDFKANQSNAVQALKDANIINLSNHSNFIFPLPNNPKYIVQIAGQKSRIFNISCDRNGIGNGWNHCANKWIKSDEDRDSLPKETVATFQTISRAATYKMLAQALETIQNAKVSIWRSWILPIDPTKHYQTANDNTHVVVQEAHGSEFIQVYDKDASKTAQNIALLSDKALLDVCKLTIAVKLFNVESNLFVNPSNGNAGLLDYEQPNDTGPSLFYNNRNNKLSTDYERGNQGKRKIEHDAGEGIESICRLLDNRKLSYIAAKVKEELNKKFALLEKFIAQEEEFKQYSQQGYAEIVERVNRHK